MKVYILLFPGGPQSNDVELVPEVKAYLSEAPVRNRLIKIIRNLDIDPEAEAMYKSKDTTGLLRYYDENIESVQYKVINF